MCSVRHYTSNRRGALALSLHILKFRRTMRARRSGFRLGRAFPEQLSMSWLDLYLLSLFVALIVLLIMRFRG